MKKIYLLPALLLTLLASCTLSMDEWVETEEDKGYEKMEKVSNPVFNFEYQFKPNTRSLTNDILEYVATVEDDSIIWFTDNIPDKWLPKPGGCVVANCCEKFPTGLIAKVLTVTHQDGMYRVLTTEASLEEAYEEFNLDLAADVFLSNPDSIYNDTVITRGAAPTPMRQTFTRRTADGKQEKIIRDWAMFRAMQSGEIEKRYGRTRASLDDIYDEDIDDSKTEESDIPIFSIAPGGEAAEAIKKVTHSGITTIEFKLYHTTKTTIRKIVRLKQKREYTNELTSSGIKIYGLIGKDLTKPKTDAAKKKIAETVDGWARNANFKKFNENWDVDEMELTIEVPLGSFPLALIIRVKPIITVGVGIYGHMDATIWFSRKQTITDVVGGRKIKDETKKKSTPANKYALNAFGKTEFTLGLEAFIGLGKKLGKKAAGIGGYGQITGSAVLNLNKTLLGDSQFGSGNEFLNLTGKVTVGAKVLTAGLFGDIDLVSKDWGLGNITFTYYPKVAYDSNFPLIEGHDEQGTYDQQTITYQFSNLGMHDIFWSVTHYPILAVFYGGELAYTTQSPDAILTDKSFKLGKQIKTLKNYNFVFKNYNYGKEYWVIPGVKDGLGRMTLYTDYIMNVQPTRMPNIEYLLTYDEEEKKYDYVYQTVGKKIDNVFKYSLQIPFCLRNSASIDEYWDDWGVYYEVVCYSKNFNKNVVKSLKNAITKSGKYVLTSTFNTSVNANENNLLIRNAGIYYKPKGSPVMLKLNNVDEKAFTYMRYSINPNDKDVQRKLKNPLKLQLLDTDFEWFFDVDGYKEIKG